MKNWTKEELAQIAKQYDSKTELKSGNRTAYNLIQINKWLPELCAHMGRKHKWTEKAIREAAATCPTRVQFREQFVAAYKTAQQTGLLDELYPPHSLESIRQIAHRYEYPKQWMNNHRASYELAKRRGWFDQIIAGMNRRRKLWSDQDLIDLAAQHKTKISLINANKVAYFLIHRRKIQDVCFAHMEAAERFPGDDDCVYVWEALDIQFNGLRVLKIGHTSHRLGHQRIEAVAKAANTRFNVLARVKIEGQASEVEAKLLKLGVNPGLDRFDGYSEFRAMTNKEVNYALELLGC